MKEFLNRTWLAISKLCTATVPEVHETVAPAESLCLSCRFEVCGCPHGEDFPQWAGRHVTSCSKHVN